MSGAGTVLVTGVGGPAGAAGARFFSGRGYRVIGTDMRPVEGDAASPAWDFRLVPPAVDPRFAEALLALAVAEDVGLVLPTVTEELPRAARLRPALRERGIALCVSDPPGVDVAGDKLLTARELRSRGVPAPRTLPGGASPDEVRALGFPLLSKPRFGRGGRGVVVHRGPEDLSRTAPGEVVFQEFLPGEELDLNLLLDRAGRAVAAVVLRKLALREGLVGNATAVERADRPEVAALGIAAARALGLEGPLDIDIRLGRGGEPAVLEVNARLGANAASAPEVLDALEESWRNGQCA